MDKILETIVMDGSPSVGFEILKCYIKKEMTFDQAITAWAVAASDQCVDWRPKLYPPLSPEVKRYILDRSTGLRKRDPSMARAVGEWSMEIRSMRETHKGDIANMKWCAEKCLENNLTQNVITLKKMIDRFENFPFPLQDYTTALLVQAKEAKERQLEKKE